ncbi:MAG TPA: response regulator [Candidatus Sulfotelmatobacter sp.]|nr:response regulator [Candidatus Sulfotelmatobacter sp.]
MAQPKAVILCVDDEENSLILRKLVLQRFGYEVITASSAKQALELLRVHKVDLVLSDQLMPGTTGTQLAKQVKATHLRVPIVIVSGVNEIPDDASNADLFISKLEGPALLSQKISEVLVRFQHAD